MSKRLIDLYRSILAVGNLHADDDGFISIAMAGKKDPCLVKGKRLVLPTKEQLANPEWKDRVVFHPMSENILRRESEVLEKFRWALNIRLNYTFATLATSLMTIAASTGEHAKLSPSQSEFLSKVKNPDEKTLEVLRKLIAAMPLNQTQKSLVSIYLKRGGSVKGRTHARVGVVSFPLYSELKKGEEDVYGVKLRVKDRTALLQLLEYMMPGLEDPDNYSRGSDSQQAPYLDALMRAVGAVAAKLNDITDRFKKHISDPKELTFPDDWVEALDNLDVYIPDVRAIPMQAGNEGTPVHKSEPAAHAGTLHKPSEPIFQHVGAQATGGTIFSQPAVAAAPPVHTGRGLDFGALMRSNPAMAPAQFGGGMGFGAQHVQPRATYSNPGPVNTGWNQQPGWGAQQPAGWGQPGWGGQPSMFAGGGSRL